MSEATTIVWFRRDLRLSDNAALVAAARRGRVVPVFIWSPEEEGAAAPAAAAKWWLHRSLERLQEALRQRGLELVFRVGPYEQELQKLRAEVNADGLVWNRRYEPAGIEVDRQIKAVFAERLDYIKSFPGYLLVEPWTLLNQSQSPFKVFTPFWKRCVSALNPPEPLGIPEQLIGLEEGPASVALEDLDLFPQIPWTEGMEANWQPGERDALDRMETFVQERVLDYLDQRNRPDLVGTSRLSPSLHFGEITPAQVWHCARRFAERAKIPEGHWKGWQFLAEVGWREFAAYLLYHFPHTVTQPLRPEFEKFPTLCEPELLKAWQRGKTGYPIVDAGMRELWHLGWMHNRVRMIVASFLIKHLLLPWQDGAAWFWDTLVDADLASNTLGWQWTAGCGADAAPFFRIFNPVTQAEKFDPQRDYIRRWVPELTRLDDRWIHCPWMAPELALVRAGIKLGVDYPEPVVDHAAARRRALDAYETIRRR